MKRGTGEIRMKKRYNLSYRTDVLKIFETEYRDAARTKYRDRITKTKS